jgi:plasmid stabilization system protein ParE
LLRLRHTNQARADLLDIWRTIAADNPMAADRVLDRLEADTDVEAMA